MKRALTSAALAVAIGFGGAASARQQEPAGPSDRRAAELEEYTALFVSLARQALAHPRLATAMPCLPHWVAGSDHVIVALSADGAGAGLVGGDILRRIGGTALTGRAGGMWDVAMRGLPHGAQTYAVTVDRRGATVSLTLPCRPDLAQGFHDAERSMWTAVTRRDWRACIERGNDMIRAFGRALSPPLMIMTRCASATTGQPHAALTDALARALLQEMVAHPDPSPDLREQLFLTLQDLDAVARSGGPDYATALRATMAAMGVAAPEVTPGGPGGRR